jgi:hypothetical protein
MYLWIEMITTFHNYRSAPKTTANVSHGFPYECDFHAMQKKRIEIKFWRRHHWQQKNANEAMVEPVRSVFGGSLESGGLFCVALGRNVAINSSSVQHKTVHSRQIWSVTLLYTQHEGRIKMFVDPGYSYNRSPLYINICIV